MIGELNLKQESPFSPSRVKYAFILFHVCVVQFTCDAFLFILTRIEESYKGGCAGRLLSSSSAGEAIYILE